MKLHFSLLTLLLINFSFSQTLIVDKKFQKGLEPLDYMLINSPSGYKLCIQEGTQTKGMSRNDHIKNIFSYDNTGKETVLTKDDNLMYLRYSSTGKTIRATEFVAMSYSGKKHKYISENRSTDFINYKKDKIFKLTPYFNDEFEWGISNTKRKHRDDIKLDKDELIFVKTDIYSRKNNVINIEKPNTDRLLGKEYAKPRNNKLGFKASLSEENELELITKSISKDYKKCTVYKTTYDESGKKINDIAFKVNLSKYNFVFSMNNHTETTLGANSLIFENNLGINGMFQDSKTKDVYIYGLMGEKARSVNFSKNKPIGYYIFKFNEKGEKTWSKTKVIKDKLFNSSLILFKISISIGIKDNIVNVYNRIDDGKDKKTYKHSFNADNGESEKSINKSAGRSRMLGSFGGIPFEYFLYAFDKLPNFKKKAFDASTIIALDEQKEISTYISSIAPSRNKILFNTIITKNGYWLLESDNKTYYKVLFFNK